MKNLVSTLALLVGVTGVASAQLPPTQREPKLSLHTMAGVFAPILPVVSIADGQNASVELESGSAVAAELTYSLGPRLGGQVALYGGFTHVRSRMNHSSAMELDGPFRSTSPVNVTTPTLGFLYRRQVGDLNVQPTLRLGVGVKFYEFNILEVQGGVQDFAGDVGIGITSVGGPVSFTAEARWMPSGFDPAFLPISTASSPKQLQSDWLFLLGFTFELGQ